MFFLVVVVGIVVLVFFHRGKSARLWRVVQNEQAERGHCQRGHTGNPECGVPVSEDCHASKEQKGRNSTTDVMGAVPDGDKSAAFLFGPPVDHQTAAGGPAHALKPAVDEQQAKHDADTGGCPREYSHGNHDQCRCCQSQRKKESGVGAVGYGCHQKFGNAICNGYCRKSKTKIAFSESFFNEIRDRKGKVFADKIVCSISKEYSDKNLQT